MPGPWRNHRTCRERLAQSRRACLATAALALLGALLACSRDPLTSVDASCRTPLDMARATEAPWDFSFPPGTGDPCSRDSDCATGFDGRASCLTRNEDGVWPGGYCTSPCRIDRNDPTSNTNPDCPGGKGKCEFASADAGVLGYCVNPCKQECRWQYDCVGGPVRYQCRPSTAKRECDASLVGSCGPGMTCVVSFSCDDTFLIPDPTECRESCDLRSPRAGCNCQRNWLGEGYCETAEVAADMGAGSRCGFSRMCKPLPCPPHYGCALGRDSMQCWKYCTPDTVRSDCGGCGICGAVKLGVGICSEVE